MKKIFTTLFLFPFLLFAQVQVGANILGEAAPDLSGTSTSMSADGKRVAIGAPFNDGNGDDAGHVRIYEERGGVWIQVGSDIDGVETGDFSGQVVSLSGDGTRVVLSGVGPLVNGSRIPEVRVFEENGGEWTQLGSSVTGNSTELFARGLSMSTDGKRIIIGTPGKNNPGARSGEVQVYEEDNGSWSLVAQFNGDIVFGGVGRAVSISADGKKVAFNLHSNANNSSGLVQVHEENGSVWTQVGMDIEGENVNEHSGDAVSLSANGERIAISSVNNDDNGIDAGHVRVFEENNGVWTQVGSALEGEASYDYYGHAISISGDGTKVAVSTPWNQGNGYEAGHARIFEEINNDWVQIGQDIDGDEAEDLLGVEISISADGTRVAIGADQLNNFDVFNPGYVKVFSTSLPLPVSILSFTAEKLNKTTQLRWTTEGEEENAGFEVQHSLNGTSWTVLGYLSGSGTTSEIQEYEFSHTLLDAGANYYRLKQFDHDGSFNLSEVRTIEYDREQHSELIVFPNPTSSQVDIFLPEKFRASPIKLFSADGKLLRTFSANALRIDLEELPAAKYLLQVEIAGEALQKWIIVR